MERSELVRRLILNEICDDYENVDQRILPDLVRDGSRLGLSIERAEIVATMASLVEDGLAKSYLLSCREPFATEIQGMPSLDVIEEDFKTYWWPFDDGA